MSSVYARTPSRNRGSEKATHGPEDQCMVMVFIFVSARATSSVRQGCNVRDVALAGACGTQAETTIVAQSCLHQLEVLPRYVTLFTVKLCQALAFRLVGRAVLGWASPFGDCSAAVGFRCTARIVTCLEHEVIWCWSCLKPLRVWVRGV